MRLPRLVLIGGVDAHVLCLYRVPAGGGMPRILAGLILNKRSSSCSVNPTARSVLATLASASGCQLEFTCPVSLDTNDRSTPDARIPSTYVFTTSGLVFGLPN